jgi:predicted DCC family thiol-disulfide oxidoreductase YuxK
MPLDSPIVVFDGVCNLCSGAVRFILNHDQSGRYMFLPLQTTPGQSLLEEHGIDSEDAETFLLIKEGIPFVRSSAALEIARDLGWWRWLRVFRVVPRPWRDALYVLVARNRYRWFGKRDTCFVPTRDERKRFIDV